MAYLKIQQLQKKYEKHTVLDNISIAVEKGEFVVLLGPSGCGKSTLLNCVAGLLKYDRGDILIEEKNMNEVHPSHRDIAMVFQSYALYPNMNVRNNISFGMKIRKESPESIEKKITEVAKILNITELLDRRPAQLSGGQQQRVAIGRALVRNPRIFLFDEPLSNLDAKLRVAMRTEIKRLHQYLKNTILYVTHDQVEAMSLADKIAVMDQGRVIQFGTPNDVYFRPSSVFVAEFIGAPPMNLIPCQVAKKGKDWTITLSDTKRKTSFKIPTGNWDKERLASLSEYCRDKQDLLLGIRPENIYYGKGVTKQLSNYRISLDVEMIEPNGADNIVVNSFKGKELIARLHSDIPLPEIEKVGVFYFDLSKALFYCPDDGNLVA